MPSVTRIDQVSRRDAMERRLLEATEQLVGYQLVRGADPVHDPRIVDVLTDIIWTTLYQR